MPQIWATFLSQQTGTSVVPSAGWINPGDVLQRRGSPLLSTVTAVIPAPSGPADPIQQSNPGDAVTLDQPPIVVMSGELANYVWLS